MLIPPAFAAPKVLRWLNIAGVGLSLAAITASVFGAIGRDFSGITTGLPTLLFGALWAWVLRVPSTVGKSNVRWGWLASIPLAALNGGFAAGIMFAVDKSSPFDIGGFFVGLALGTTFGAFVWVPALVATLVAFGLPIALSQNMAKKGLAGEERGERVIGIVCAVLGLSALGMALAGSAVPGSASDVWSRHESFVVAGRVFTYAAAILGTLVGTTAATLAHVRDRRRKAFVADAEQGKIPGFRVDETPEGKALVRVSSQGQGYRVADFSQEVFLLDQEGNATEARVAEGR